LGGGKQEKWRFFSPPSLPHRYKPRAINPDACPLSTPFEKSYDVTIQLNENSLIVLLPGTTRFRRFLQIKFGNFVGLLTIF